MNKVKIPIQRHKYFAGDDHGEDYFGKLKPICMDDDVSKLEAYTKELQESLREYVVDNEVWMQEDGENLLGLLVGFGIGEFVPYNIETHGKELGEEWDIEEGDKIWWFGKDEPPKPSETK